MSTMFPVGDWPFNYPPAWWGDLPPWSRWPTTVENNTSPQQGITLTRDELKEVIREVLREEGLTENTEETDA